MNYSLNHQKEIYMGLLLKNLRLPIVIMMCIIMSSAGVAGAKNVYSRDVTVLPAAAQTTIKANFKSEVSYIKVEKSLGRVTEYEVVLTDGSEITFDSKGNWKEVEVSIKSSVPQKIVPQAITDYVKQEQKKAKIVGIERKRYGYDVELSNGVEMIFNAEGKFIRYDN